MVYSLNPPECQSISVNKFTGIAQNIYLQLKKVHTNTPLDYKQPNFVKM